jgi:hypothetical protein
MDWMLASLKVCLLSRGRNVDDHSFLRRRIAYYNDSSPKLWTAEKLARESEGCVAQGGKIKLDFY